MLERKNPLVFNIIAVLLSLLCFLIAALSHPAPIVADETPPPATVQSSDAGGRQATPALSRVEFNEEYFSGYLTDLKSIVTAPVRWDASDWFTAGITTGIAAGLYCNDEKIMKWIQDHKTTTSVHIGDTVTDFGHGKYTPIILGGMYLYGHVADDNNMRGAALLSVESFVLTGLIVQVTKHLTHRHRPDTGDPPHTFDGPAFHSTSSNSSLPSGHASSAFAVASVIASVYDNAVIPPLAYGIAGITALNRVQHNAHWPSDVFVGSAIGYFTGKLVVSSHRTSGNGKLSLVPVMNEEGMGLAMMYRF